MATRGPKSISVRWTKGHAADEHIAARIATLESKKGNEKANALADKGRETVWKPVDGRRPQSIIFIINVQ